MDKELGIFVGIFCIAILMLGALQIANWVFGIQLSERFWKCTERSELKEALIGEQKYQTCIQYTKLPTPGE